MSTVGRNSISAFCKHYFTVFDKRVRREVKKEASQAFFKVFLKCAETVAIRRLWVYNVTCRVGEFCQTEGEPWRILKSIYFS